MKNLTRRQFVRNSSLGAGLLILPAGSARTYAANEKVDVAFVGVGGVARGNRTRMNKLSKEANIVALCDVDSAPIKSLNGSRRCTGP